MSFRPSPPTRADVRVGAHEHAEVALEAAQPADRLGPVVVEREVRGPGPVRALLAPHHLRARQERLDAVGHRDRPGAGPAAAVRLRERLVQVEVHDVEAHVARPRDAHHRVEVGAVVVERGAHVVHDARDLADVAVEQPERVRVREHQAGHVVRGLRAQVVQVHAAVGVGAHLHHLVAGHRHGGRVGAVRRVGREHLVAVLAAVLVERAREQQAGQFAVRAGAGLKRHVRQPADLGQRALQVPHQLERALGVLVVLQRVQAREAGQRRHALVQLGVVLHRARAQRVEARVEVEVLLREVVVVAHDLGLGDLGQLGRLARGWPTRAAAPRSASRARPVAGGMNARRPSRLFSKIVSVIAPPPSRDAGHERGQTIDVLLGAPLGDGHEQAVRVLRVVAPKAVAGVDALARARLNTRRCRAPARRTRGPPGRD